MQKTFTRWAKLLIDTLAEVMRAIMNPQYFLEHYWNKEEGGQAYG